MHSTLKTQRAMATLLRYGKHKTTQRNKGNKKPNTTAYCEWCCTFNWIVKSFIEWKISVNFISIHSPHQKYRRCEYIIRLNSRPFPLMLDCCSFLRSSLSLTNLLTLSLGACACIGFELCVRSSENCSIQLIIIDKVVFMHIAFLNAPHQATMLRANERDGNTWSSQLKSSNDD